MGFALQRGNENAGRCTSVTGLCPCRRSKGGIAAGGPVPRALVPVAPFSVDKTRREGERRS